MNENEYKKGLLLASIKKYRQVNKTSFSTLKSIENLIENSHDLPLSTIYVTLRHLEQEKSNVLDEINTTLSEMLPKSEDTSDENNTENTAEKTTPENAQENKEKTEEQEHTKKESSTNDQSKEKQNYKDIIVDDNLDDSDEDFDLED